MEQLGINLSFLVAQIINFILLLIILRAVAYKPLLGMLEQRRQRIAKALEDARQAEEARANADRDYQKRMDEARLEAQRIVAEASQRAEQAASGILAKAQEEAQRLIEQAREEAELERNRILAELRTQVASLAIAAANKVISESLDEQRQRRLIQEFFSGVRAGRIQLAEDSDLPQGSTAVVTSALPLTDEEQMQIRADLAQRAGATQVQFRVDPSILGGLVIRIGDKIVDSSVAGRMEAMRQSIH